MVLGSSQAVYGEGKYECRYHGIQYPKPRTLTQLELGQWEIKCPFCSNRMAPVTTDESIVNPHNQYAISKYCQELYALTLGKRYDIPTVVLRYSITQGPRQSFYNAYSGILRIFTTRLINNLPPIVYEDGKQLRDYVYVGDVAHANLMVMENNAANYEVFNVGGEKEIAVVDYAKLLSNILNKNIKPKIPAEFRFGDTRHIISDIKKLEALGWEPKITLKNIIEQYLEWVMTQGLVSDHYSKAEGIMKQQGVIRLVR